MTSSPVIEIKGILINDVKRLKDYFNTNNHWENGKKPKDYNSVIESTYTKRWIDQFHSAYFKLEITGHNLKWMKECNKIFQITGRLPESYNEEIEEAADTYELHELEKVFPCHPGYFVRTENVSLKTGIHGVGPYTNMKMIIESLVTCKLGHSPFYSDSQQSITVYIMVWKPINEFREFRVFVNSGKITAISQQNIYKVNEIIKECNRQIIQSNKENVDKIVEAVISMRSSNGLHKDALKLYSYHEHLIEKWIQIIWSYFNETISKKITHLDSYVMDIAILEENKPYFIEINPFGKKYTSGSALFNWIQDEDCLYNSDVIQFRYTSD